MDMQTSAATLVDTGERSKSPRTWVLLLACLLLILGLHLHLALTRTINWDEFHFLSRVHDYARGELTLPLQTLHVRFFEWLAHLEGPGVDQILRARLAMFGALIGTCIAIFAVARRFASREAALICSLAYLAGGYVLQHGTAFRFDPIVACLSMTALAIFTRTNLRWPWITVFAALLGIAFMVSMKMVLYLPAFAGMAWLRWSEADFDLRRAITLGLAAALAATAAGLLYLWHSAGLPPSDDAATMVGRASGAMFGISPNLRFSARAILVAAPTFLLLIFLTRAFRSPDGYSTSEKVALAGLAAPLGSLLIYTNTFPYFHAFIMAPVCAALAGSLRYVVPRHGAANIAIVFVVWAAAMWASDKPSQLSKQRQLQIVASEIFPERVKYFDFAGFLPQHSKANFFMSNWGFHDYRAGLFPSFTEILAEETVPLVAAVDPELNPTMSNAVVDGPNSPFFVPGDVDTIRDTYRNFWGPYWLAGTELEAETNRLWTVRVPGIYTVQGSLAVSGKKYLSGQTLHLDRGDVSLEATSDKAGLVYGDNIQVPDLPVPTRPYWTPF